MFSRQITPTLTRAVSQFPITVLTGPRQSGKTTLLRLCFPEFTYVSLESPDQLLIAQADPRGFLQSATQGLIIDEAQNYPELFSYLQEMLDLGQIKYKIILSGSQNFLLAEKISQTLSGRAVLFELLPLTYREYCTDATCPPLSLNQFLYLGAYPRPYHEQLPATLWYTSYIKTYLERDVRSIVNVRNLSQFQLFLKHCAAQHGQEFNASVIATALGVSQTNIMHWLGILEASYIVFRLPPFYKNFRKRLSKRHKLYFYDSAIVCHLLGIESTEHLAIHPHRGAIFEGVMITEVIKSHLALGKQPALYFWREHAGLEIDLLIEKGQELCLIEAKAGATFLPKQLANLEKMQITLQEQLQRSILVYAGDKQHTIGQTAIIPWQQFGILIDQFIKDK